MELKHNPIRALKNLHFALCIVPFLFIVITHLFVREIELTGMMGSLNVFGRIGLGIGVINVLTAAYLFNKKTKELGPDINSENLNEFGAAYFLKWLLIETAILMNVMFYYFEGTGQINIVIAISLLCVLYFSKPRIVLSYFL